MELIETYDPRGGGGGSGYGTHIDGRLVIYRDVDGRTVIYRVCRTDDPRKEEEEAIAEIRNYVEQEAMTHE